MIINEKYLRDIDDEDDDGLTSDISSSRSMYNANLEHTIQMKYGSTLRVQPGVVDDEKPDRLTYYAFTEVYDKIDDVVDSTMSITDYSVNVTADVGNNQNWWVESKKPPTYDSDTDYGKSDEFDAEKEQTIQNFCIQVSFNAKKMRYEEFVHIIIEINNCLKEMSYRAYSMGLQETCINYTIDGKSMPNARAMMWDNHAYTMKEFFYEAFPSKLKEQDPSSYPKKFEYRNDCTLSKKSEKTIGNFVFGDILYETSEGDLVSQDTDENGKRNTPVGIYVLPYRFISVRYMSTFNPNAGSKRFTREENLIIYGSKGARIYAENAPCSEARYGNTNTHKNSDHYSGEADYRKMLDYMNKTYPKSKDKSAYFANYIDKHNVKGILQGALCTYRFHTKGTSQGNWYIPSPSELWWIFDGYRIATQMKGDFAQDMIANDMTKEINNTAMIKIVDAINFILKTKLHLQPLNTKYYYMSSREYDKNNYVGISSYRGMACQNEKDEYKACVVLPFIYVNDEH